MLTSNTYRPENFTMRSQTVAQAPGTHQHLCELPWVSQLLQICSTSPDDSVKYTLIDRRLLLSGLMADPCDPVTGKFTSGLPCSSSMGSCKDNMRKTDR